MQGCLNVVNLDVDRKLDVEIIVLFIRVFNLLQRISGLVLTELCPEDILW